MHELLDARTIKSKTYWLSRNKRAIDCHINPMHYYDNGWLDIEPDVIASDRPNWDWEVSKGLYILLAKEDTTVALGKEDNWIGFRFDGAGYLDWDTKNYEII